MCNECSLKEIKESEFLFVHDQYNKVINHVKINTTDSFHCLTGPARFFYKDNIIVYKYWYINDQWIENCDSQEDFIKSEEYRKWKLKVFK